MPLDEDGFAFEAFEWDANKNLSNVAKHGIDFAEALLVFSDPAAVIFEPTRQRQEMRRLIVGRVAEMFVTVVFTHRGERIRIISARRSRNSERKRYGQ
jgi:hypothetical protein